MRCLWVTFADPDPRHNGQYVYSGGLIDALAASGAEVTVLGTTRPESPPRIIGCDGVRWCLIDRPPRSPLASLVSPLPHLASRTAHRAAYRKLDELIGRERWDGIVLDGLSGAWALPTVRRRYAHARHRPRVIYVSHNHEESLRRRVAARQRNPAMRAVMEYDALKVMALERAVLRSADLVTAITADDRDLYAARSPGKPIFVLTPGYTGRYLDGRRITPDTPRRAVIVGSYHWIAKRMNLEDFLSVADPMFAAAGAELHVVGAAEPAFIARWKRRVSATRFTGTVDGVAPFMDQARVGIVPERVGGGFKLKVLDYVFNRMPILALDGSVAGIPLRHDESILLYPDHESLARGALRVIDDVDRLNRMQDRAYAQCRDKFDWQSRGRALLAAMAA